MRKAAEALLCVAGIAVGWAWATTNACAQPANSPTAAPAAQQGGVSAAVRPSVPPLTVDRQKRDRAQSIRQSRSHQFLQHPELAKLRRSHQFRQHPEWAKLRRSHQFRQHPEWAKLRRSRQFHRHPEWAKQRRWWLLHHQQSQDAHRQDNAPLKGRNTHRK
jgi:hypothetical protein